MVVCGGVVNGCVVVVCDCLIELWGSMLEVCDGVVVI